MTPRKFYSQLLVHREMNSYKDKEDSSQEEGYIDQIAGW